MELNKDLKIENSTKTLSDLLVPLDYFNYLGFETKEFGGAKWFKIYYHDSRNGSVLWNEQQLFHTLETYRWSLMGMIPSFYNTTYGGYEFLLEYPEINKHNRWSQTSDPMRTSQSVSGYKAIDVQMTSNSWGGLSISSTKGTSTILDGSPSSTEWWYAIGPQTNYNGGVPGENTTVQKTYLWIRIG